MSFLAFLTTPALYVFGFMTFAWFVAQLLHDNSYVDIAWGLGFIVLGVATFLERGVGNLLSFVATVLVVLWGLRLAVHIGRRKIGTPEDKRYQEFRKGWKRFPWLHAYIKIFLLQGVLMFIVALPVLIINYAGGSNWGLLATIGLVVWVIGFYFEVVGDYQLSKFIQDPDTEGLITTGLWKYTRHPNYFGEATMWWGLGIMALSVPYGYFGLLGSVFITILLLYFSGVPMLEKSMSKKPGWEEYAKRTNKFFPGPPKH